MYSNYISLIVKSVLQNRLRSVWPARPHGVGTCQPDVIFVVSSCSMLNCMQKVTVQDIGNL